MRIFPGSTSAFLRGGAAGKATPEDTYAAVAAALKAGSGGVILSRKYSEMRLENLAAAELRRPRFFRLIQGRAEFSGVGPALPVGHGRVCFTGEFADRECRSVPAGFLSTSLLEGSLGSPDRLCHHGEWFSGRTRITHLSCQDATSGAITTVTTELRWIIGQPVEFIRFRARHSRRHAARGPDFSCPGFMVSLRTVPGGLAE